MKYKKNNLVDAIQYNGKNRKEIEKFFHDLNIRFEIEKVDDGLEIWVADSQSGTTHHVTVGKWIVCTALGKIRTAKPELFEKAYVPYYGVFEGLI